MAIPVFRIGPPQRPDIRHDDGHLGVYPSRKPTAEDRAQLRKWIGKLEIGEAIQGLPFLPHNNIPDALAAYRHFLFGEGKSRNFLYERYVKQDASGKITLENALLQTELAAETLAMLLESKPNGHRFSMTSSAIPCGADPEDSPWGEFAPYPETENWQKAIGAHFIWLSADVDVRRSPLGPSYTMMFTLHAEDRYNFNPGAQDIATGIPDADNGRFELTGLGHQYTNYSRLTRVVRWQGGIVNSSHPARNVSGPTGRARKPQDNRRARNRV